MLLGMDALFFGTAQLGSFLLPAICVLIASVLLIERFAEVRRHRRRDNDNACLTVAEGVTRAEFSSLIKKQTEINQRNEGRLAGIEKTTAVQLQEIQRSLGRIEGKVEFIKS